MIKRPPVRAGGRLAFKPCKIHRYVAKKGIKYAIDELLARLRNAWTGINVSTEAYARALKAAGRRPIHHNTLRKLETANPQFTDTIRRRSKRHKLTAAPIAASTEGAHSGAARH